MKTSIIIVLLGVLGVGCSTTTYLNLTENDKGKIRRELNAYEKDQDVGAEVILALYNGTEFNGELLSVRDSSLNICTEHSATEEELANSTYPIIPVRNNEIQEMTIEGSSYVWTGIVIGAIAGSIIGYLIGHNSASESDKTGQGLGGLAGGSFGSWAGLAAGGIIGYELSIEEYVLQEIPPSYNFSLLKPLARYPDVEPEYLRAIK